MDVERTLERFDVVVLDPHPIWLDAIEMVLERIGANVVLKTTSSDDALATIERSQPQLLILELDSQSGEPDGFEVMRRAKTLAPALRSIVLSPTTTRRTSTPRSQSGAAAYVVKTAQPDDVAAAVRQAFDHSVYLAGGPRPIGKAPVSVAPPTASAPRPDASRARNPSVGREGALELPTCPHALGDRADGQVPPLQHLSQARRLQPYGGQPLGPAQRRALARDTRRRVSDLGVSPATMFSPGRARWGASGSLNPQSATAGLNPLPGVASETRASGASVDGQVPRTVSLRTASGPGGSSAKECLAGAADSLARARPGCTGSVRAHDRGCAAGLGID